MKVEKSPFPPELNAGFLYGFPGKIWLAKTPDGIQLIHQLGVYLALRDKFEIAEYDFSYRNETP